MIRKLSRILLVLAGIVSFSFSLPQKSHAEITLFSILKDFFKKSIGTGPLPEKVEFQTNVDWARWNERIKTRDLFKQKYLLGDHIIDILNLNQDSNPDAINVSSGDPGLDPTNPDIAYDTTMNRYLVVWEEETSPGIFNILGQFRDRAGATVGSVVTISSPRTAQGCFYANFDADNGAISTPASCPRAANPAVAYNNGRYLITWELKGRGDFARNSDGSDNNAGKDFSNIIAKVVNASDLNPVSPDWAEGIMISRVWIASNVSTEVSNDNEIQAWAQALNPDVAPKLGGNGFVVTWQSNVDFIGCVDPNRRDSSSIYARYIDQTFSSTAMPGSSTNKPLTTVYKDPSTITSTCPTLSNVMKAQKPRIAFNTTRSDFVIAFEFARAASATKGDIGAKRLVLNAGNDATLNNAMMPEVVASAPEGTTYSNPDIASYGSNRVLAYDDGTNVFVKNLNTTSGEVASGGDPAMLALGGTGARTEPRIGGNIGIGGTRPSASTDPQRVLVSYTQAGALKAALVDDTLAIRKGPVTVSGTSTANHVAEVGSDLVDFFVVWAGTAGGLEQVWGAKVNADRPPPDCTWNASNPVTPANGVTWAPTRLFLDWNACTATVSGDTLLYDVYFASGGSSGTNPYKSGLNSSTTSFVIQSSTDNRPQYNPDGGVTAVFLAPSSTYTWRICARNSSSSGPTDGPSCSPDRTFNTDDSVVGWWRFDDDPAAFDAGLSSSVYDCTTGPAGRIVCDFSGKANHGTPNGGPTWLVPMPDILGRALQFNGTSQYIAAANSVSLNLPTTISFEALIRPQGSGRIISRDDIATSSAGNYVIVVTGSTGNITFAFYDGVGSTKQYNSPSTPLTLGVRGLLSARHTFGNAGSTEIRVNNIVQPGAWSGGTGNELPLMVNSSLGIGSNSPDIGTGNFFNGSMDELVLYNKYLDVTELSNGLSTRP